MGSRHKRTIFPRKNACIVRWVDTKSKPSWNFKAQSEIFLLFILGCIHITDFAFVSIVQLFKQLNNVSLLAVHLYLWLFLENISTISFHQVRLNGCRLLSERTLYKLLEFNLNKDDVQTMEIEMQGCDVMLLPSIQGKEGGKHLSRVYNTVTEASFLKLRRPCRSCSMGVQWLVRDSTNPLL